MSKSKGNVVDPNALIEKYGADTARLFSLFAAPPEKDLDWSDQGVDGSYRFLNRVWKLVHDTLPLLAHAGAVNDAALDDDAKALRRSVHKTIRKVTEDIEDRFHFNTAIAAIMEMVNFIHGFERKNDPRNAAALKEAMESLVLLLVPFVPHIASELWQELGHTEGVDAAGWPAFDPAAAADEELLVVVQVNGKLRSKIMVRPDAAAEEMEAAALADERIKPFVEGKTVRKVISVPGKLVNIVVG
jgi:leucyl-tRNA synthetase